MLRLIFTLALIGRIRLPPKRRVVGRHAVGNVRTVPSDYNPLPYALRCRIRARCMRQLTDKYPPVLIGVTGDE